MGNYDDSSSDDARPDPDTKWSKKAPGKKTQLQKKQDAVINRGRTSQKEKANLPVSAAWANAKYGIGNVGGNGKQAKQKRGIPGMPRGRSDSAKDREVEEQMWRLRGQKAGGTWAEWNAGRPQGGAVMGLHNPNSVDRMAWAEGAGELNNYQKRTVKTGGGGMPETDGEVDVYKEEQDELWDALFHKERGDQRDVDGVEVNDDENLVKKENQQGRLDAFLDHQMKREWDWHWWWKQTGKWTGKYKKKGTVAAAAQTQPSWDDDSVEDVILDEDEEDDFGKTVEKVNAGGLDHGQRQKGAYASVQRRNMQSTVYDPSGNIVTIDNHTDDHSNIDHEHGFGHHDEERKRKSNWVGNFGMAPQSPPQAQGQEYGYGGDAGQVGGWPPPGFAAKSKKNQSMGAGAGGSGKFQRVQQKLDKKHEEHSKGADAKHKLDLLNDEEWLELQHAEHKAKKEQVRNKNMAGGGSITSASVEGDDDAGSEDSWENAEERQMKKKKILLNRLLSRQGSFAEEERIEQIKQKQREDWEWDAQFRRQNRKRERKEHWEHRVKQFFMGCGCCLCCTISTLFGYWFYINFVGGPSTTSTTSLRPEIWWRYATVPGGDGNTTSAYAWMLASDDVLCENEETGEFYTVPKGQTCGTRLRQLESIGLAGSIRRLLRGAVRWTWDTVLPQVWDGFDWDWNWDTHQEYEDEDEDDRADHAEGKSIRWRKKRAARDADAA